MKTVLQGCPSTSNQETGQKNASANVTVRFCAKRVLLAEKMVKQNMIRSSMVPLSSKVIKVLYGPVEISVHVTISSTQNNDT